MFLKNDVAKNGGLHYARIPLAMKRSRLHFSFNILDRFLDTKQVAGLSTDNGRIDR
jgi:hypothetical protein